MPYKDTEKEREASKERMKRYRQKGVTEQGVTKEGVTLKDEVETVQASYVEGLEGRKYLNLPERPRYLELSGGQVLDRENQPSPTFSHVMKVCNERAFNYRPLAGELSQELRERLKV